MRGAEKAYQHLIDNLALCIGNLAEYYRPGMTVGQCSPGCGTEDAVSDAYCIGARYADNT